mmetsp:Transcript_24323/g.38512  ORF Transcript_24323/g.38512 Transcript_24323/m.38512 type:complete len:340 (-) Transcript_24323:446-1465(-)
MKSSISLLVLAMLLLSANVYGFHVPQNMGRALKSKALKMQDTDLFTPNIGVDVPGFDADVGSLFDQPGMKSDSRFKTGRSLYLEYDDTILCYDAFYGDKKSTVYYLTCLNTPKNDCRSTQIETYCRDRGYNFITADYYGVGRSGGTFTDGCPSKWVADTIKVIEELSSTPKVVLCGSGVGGWIAVLVALQRPDLVSGIVGLAADPDFTEDLLMKYLSEDEINKIMENGVHTIKWGATSYPISKRLLEDGRENLVLRGAKSSLNITCPVRLVHSMADEEVPFSTAVRLASCIKGNDVKINLLKSNSHHLDNDVGFSAMKAAVEDCIKSYFEFDLTTPASG